MAVERIAAIQALVIGVVFVWAGAWKLFSPGAPIAAWNSALSKMLPRREWAVAAHRLIGAGELLVAALLLLSPWHWLGIRIATVFAIGFIVYMVVARRIAPNRSCGCMGGKATRISRWSVLRAAWLLMLTLVGWIAQDFWANALVAAPWLVLPIAIEAIVIWQLSPERGKALSMRHLFVSAMRSWLDPECRGVAFDWEPMEAKLRDTATFQQLVPLLGARTDQWREGCWGFITYAANYQMRNATAVFAVPVRFDAGDVSAAVVDDATNATLLVRPAVDLAYQHDPTRIAEAIGNRSPSAA